MNAKAKKGERTAFEPHSNELMRFRVHSLISPHSSSLMDPDPSMTTTYQQKERRKNESRTDDNIKLFLALAVGRNAKSTAGQSSHVRDLVVATVSHLEGAGLVVRILPDVLELETVGADGSDVSGTGTTSDVGSDRFLCNETPTREGREDRERRK